MILHFNSNIFASETFTTAVHLYQRHLFLKTSFKIAVYLINYYIQMQQIEIAPPTSDGLMCYGI